ncbi:MAG: hypothetical protein IPO87_17970 [Flavobacteriales bacterium]|nr:hypothetical protein [Flavobacteriales bacterium]
MTSRSFLLIATLFVHYYCDAQDNPPADTTRTKDLRVTEPSTGADAARFLFFTIPNFLNGSSIDPSPVSNVSVDMANEELRLKLGFPALFKRYKVWRERDVITWSVSPYTKANKDPKSTLFSKGSWTGVYGVDVGLNIVPRHIKWIATDAGVRHYHKWSLDRVENGVDDTLRKDLKPGDRVSELIGWVSLRGNLEQKEYTLFYPGSAYSDLKDVRTLGLGRGYVSLNGFFHSILKSKRWWNMMGGAGIGTGSFTNYTTLPERTLQEGAIVYNADSSAVRIVSEATAGRSGPMVISTGTVAFLEYYKTVAFFGLGGELRLGCRYDAMGVGKDTYNTRLAPGVFINAKKP